MKIPVHSRTTSTPLRSQAIFFGSLSCTLSNEPFDYEINSTMKVLVKFGDKHDYSNDELIILPHGSHTLELDQLFYEMIVLSMPIRNVNP